MNTLVLIALLILLLWNVLLTLAMFNQKNFFRNFTKGIAKSDLKTLLVQLGQTLKTVSQKLNHQQNEIKLIQQNAQNYFQKIGFIRFNPFSDTGGDQSFCICILDNHNSGFVITSLHSREQTRIYAKKIKDGKSQGIDFSKEEVLALNQALNRK